MPSNVRAQVRIPLSAILPIDRHLWSILFGLAAIAVPWSVISEVSFTGIWPTALVIIAALGFGGAYKIVRPLAYRIHNLIETATALIAYTAILGPISYFACRGPYVPQDVLLARIDQILGFDWERISNFIHGNKLLLNIFDISYNSLLLQSAAVIIIIPTTRYPWRGFDFIRISLLAALITIFMSHYFPAGMGRAINQSWYPDWKALRSPDQVTFSFPRLEGIITFPSLHAAIGIIVIYIMRGLGYITVGFIILDVLMIAATPTIGYHYLSDVIAGVIVALISIGLHARFLCGFRGWKNPNPKLDHTPLI
jgi:hypothetical protein